MKIKKNIIKFEKSLHHKYIKLGRPLLPVSKFIREPMRWYYHQSKFLRHDSKMYIKPFLLERLHSWFVDEHPQDFYIYNNQIRFRSSGSMMSMQAYYVGEVEYHLIQYLVSTIRPDFVMIDIGAHHGAYTLIVAHELRNRGWKGVIHSFEPDSRNFSLLEYNIQQNNLEDYVVLHNQAVGSIVGKQNFYKKEDNSSNFLLYSNNYLEEQNIKGNLLESVEVNTIDNICTALNSVDLIKLDIQGGESYALKGGNKTINNYQPILLVEAVAEWESTQQVIKILDEYNYLIRGVNKKGEICEINSKDVFVSWDLVALPK
jgi:FkbM family methyltransferase